MRRLQLVHGVLDAQLLDRHHEKIGRVDGLVLELVEGQPLRVAAVLVGGAVRDERMGRWAVGLKRLLRRMARIESDGVSRIPFSALREISHIVEVDVEREALASEHVERWLCDRIVRRVPGGDRDEK